MAKRHFKRLILCLDGTWNSPDHGHATNVVKIMRAIAAEDDRGTPQVVFYDAGVGADGVWVGRVSDGVTGRGWAQNVRDGYRFLAHNWMPGDEVYVFGFSRGAFTARSLCGFVDLFGLLPKRGMDHLLEAWRLYRTPAARRDRRRVAELARDARHGVKVTCLGVWDTVEALGVPLQLYQKFGMGRRFHDAGLRDNVECAFHALAIDEMRGPFGPVLWQKRVGQPIGQKVVEQVWFPGAHSDVGGGWPDSGLSDVTLRWMIRRVQANSALAFDEGYVTEEIRPDPLGPIHDSAGLYALSRILPFRRLIGQTPVQGAGRWELAGLLRRLVRHINRPEEGCEFVNEMIHWSAVHRFGNMAKGALRRYEPGTLAAALNRVPVAGTDVVPVRRPGLVDA